MRRFIITGHRAVTTGDFKLDDICGGAGRLDILVRCINASFFLSHGIRRDSETYLVLEGGEDAPKTVRFSGSDIRYLNPDERSTSSLIRNALLKDIPEGEEIRASPGVFVSRMGFSEVLDKLSGEGCTFVLMKEDGTDCRDYQFPDEPAFVLGDSSDLTEDEMSILDGKGHQDISVGPNSLLASHCIIVVNNEMDRRSSSVSEIEDI